MTLTVNGKTYELRGGEWLNEENKCFYDVVGAIGAHGYYLCRDVLDREFALYLPDYGKFAPRVDLKCCRVTYKDIWGNVERTNYYLEQDENFIDEVFLADYSTAAEIIDFEFIE